MSLVDQMRTCAAAITASQSSGKLDMNLMVSDAARLLTEAADLLDVQSEPLAAILLPQASYTSRQALHASRHFDDGSKRNIARGNDPQAMRSIGRQR